MWIFLYRKSKSLDGRFLHPDDVNKDDNLDTIRRLNQSLQTELDMLLIVRNEQQKRSWESNTPQNLNQMGNCQMKSRLEAEEAILLSRISLLKSRIKTLVE